MSKEFTKSYVVEDMEVSLFKGYNCDKKTHALIIVVIINDDKLTIDKTFESKELRDKSYDELNFNMIYKMFDSFSQGVGQLVKDMANTNKN